MRSSMCTGRAQRPHQERVYVNDLKNCVQLCSLSLSASLNAALISAILLFVKHVPDDVQANGSQGQ